MDMIDFSQAVIAPPDCPDIRSWPIFAPITRVHLADREVYVRGNVSIEFPGRDQLIAATPPGWDSGIAYTAWMGFFVGGRWHFAPVVECIGAYIPTGPLFAPQQVAKNLLYYDMATIRGYQPAPGERVAWVCTTGDTRRMNVQAGTPGRTNVVVVPFAVGDYRNFAVNPTPQPTPTPTPTPIPIPTPVPYDKSQLDAVLESVRLVLVTLNQIDTRLKTLEDRPDPTYDARYIGPIVPRPRGEQSARSLIRSMSDVPRRPDEGL